MLLFKFAFIKKITFYYFSDFSAKTLPSTSQKHLQRSITVTRQLFEKILKNKKTKTRFHLSENVRF